MLFHVNFDQVNSVNKRQQDAEPGTSHRGRCQPKNNIPESTNTIILIKRFFKKKNLRKCT